MRRIFQVAMVSMAALVAGCGNSASPGGSASSSGGNGNGGGAATAGKVRFLVLGDTGAPLPLNTDMHGESNNVAAVAEQVCALRGCDFALLAGDNIYESGVTSVADPLFELAFQEPFAGLEFPFFLALGNHDNAITAVGEGGGNFKGDAQVAYTTSPLNLGQKWNMPDRYYSQVWPREGAPLLEVFVLDSSPITHFYDDPSPLWAGAAGQAYVAEQQVFMQDALAASTAPWKFALAHHPYISNGSHGNAGSFDVDASTDPCTIAGPLASATCRGVEYKAFLEQTICDKVDIFFNGHDHNLYWLQPVASCGKTHHVLSGAGSKERPNEHPERNAAYYQQGGLYGFFWFELDAGSLRGAAYEIQEGGVPNAVDAAGNPQPAFEMTLNR